MHKAAGRPLDTQNTPPSPQTHRSRQPQQPQAYAPEVPCMTESSRAWRRDWRLFSFLSPPSRDRRCALTPAPRRTSQFDGGYHGPIARATRECPETAGVLSGRRSPESRVCDRLDAPAGDSAWEGLTRGSLPEGGPFMPVIEHYRIWKSALRRTSRTGADKEVDCNVLGGQLLKPRDQGSSDSTEKRAAPSPA